MYARVHAKNPPSRPPRPVLRPGEFGLTTIGTGDVPVVGMTAERNLAARERIVAGSLSFEEMDAAIERQTGARRGIEVANA